MSNGSDGRTYFINPTTQKELVSYSDFQGWDEVKSACKLLQAENGLNEIRVDVVAGGALIFSKCKGWR